MASGFGRIRAAGAAAAWREPFSLVVDLADEPLGPRWLRGAATLAALCGSALLLAPGAQAFGTGGDEEEFAQPARLGALLAPPSPAARAPRPIDPAAFTPTKPRRDETDNAVRLRGPVSDGLYWSLRGAGIEPDAAAEYLRAIATRVDMAEIAPYDRFDLVFAKRGGATGALLFVGLERAQGDNVKLMRWTVGGRTGWFDGNMGERRSSAMMAPVAGRITSSFGSRVHPILRFTRFHSGVDFGARWGSPVVAAADGQVVGAGWTGGYGRQVRVAHGNGVVTSYSHMSSIAAAPGTTVRQGQVIGYVGSTGLSTGPHLHFEVRVGGRAVNPLAVRLQTRAPLSGAELQAFKARMKALTAIGEKAA